MSYRQKPDAITPAIRDLYKVAGIDFDEPPPGYGCDFIVYQPHDPRTICIEAKDPHKPSRMTDKEKRLQEICERNGIPYRIVNSLESAASAAGIELG